MSASESGPDNVAAFGEDIYLRLLKDEYERTQAGKFVAIDVDSETPYIADTPEEAIAAGRSASPHGRFHVVHVGQPALH